ncbi:MAG: ABC transporter permease [Candidatus Binatia bacterium]|nr:ABC transporter permease [Candidatus Binatia bacterium]
MIPERYRLSQRTIRAILRREFTDVLRDRRSLLLTFLWPVSMLLLYGYGIRYDINNVPLTVLDYDRSSHSRLLVEQMVQSGYFQLVREADNYDQVQRDLTIDASRAAIVIPPDFGRRLRSGEPVTVQALFDGTDSNTASIAQSYVLAMVASFGARADIGLVERSGGVPAVRVASRVWYNPELQSVNFIVPGVIAVIMMIVGAILTALSIVKEKERGTIEQILVSPIRPLEMMIGKIVPYVIIALLDLAIVITAGYFVFGVPIKGSLWQLAIFSVLYLTASLGTGVFVSTLADTMQSAMLAAIFISLLPAVLLSGFVFPLEHMPVGIRLLSYFFPGRYFVAAIRGIYLKGVGLEVLWPEAVMLAAFSIGIVWLSANRFQEKLG